MRPFLQLHGLHSAIHLWKCILALTKVQITGYVICTYDFFQFLPTKDLAQKTLF